MNPADFVGIAIVGAGISTLHYWLNKKYAIGSTTNRGIVIAASCAIGGLYFWLRQTVWWETIIGVLGAASTFYAIFLKQATD